jgi:putative hydroxymethylpyrimidine transport system substrate-binding protein
MLFISLLLCGWAWIPNQAAAREFIVLLDWFVNPDHAAFIVAKQRGRFEDQGLDVQLIEPGDPSMPPKLAAAKQADLAVSYQPSLMVDINNELPLVRVGSLVDTPLNSLVVLADGPIQSMSDLRGKTVGFSVGGFEDAILGAMLEHHGLSLDDVSLVNVNFALSPSLYAGQVDAVIGAFRNFELNQMDLDQRPGRAFFPEDHGVPTYEELILVAHPDKARDPDLQNVLDVLDAVTAEIIEDPEAAWKDFVAYNAADLDNALNARAWRDTLPKLARDVRASNPTAWTAFAEFMQRRGLISEVPPVSSYLWQHPDG